MKYNPSIVSAYFEQNGIVAPEYEYVFASPRKWRFDLAWPESRLALEVQGGIFVAGRHSRGAALLKEWEKLNEAAFLGWRVLFCQPSDLCMFDTLVAVKRALAVGKE